MKKSLFLLMLIVCVALSGDIRRQDNGIIRELGVADRLDIVDMLMASGIKEEFDASWQRAYAPLKKRVEESNLSQKQKNWFTDIFDKIGTDTKLIREIVKVQVNVMTQDMTDEEVNKFAKQLRNPILQKANELMLQKKIKWEKFSKKDKQADKYFEAIKKRATKEEYEEFQLMLEDATNAKAMANLAKAIDRGTLDSDIELVMLNMVFGRRITMDIKKLEMI